MDTHNGEWIHPMMIKNLVLWLEWASPKNADVGLAVVAL